MGEGLWGRGLQTERRAHARPWGSGGDTACWKTCKVARVVGTGEVRAWDHVERSFEVRSHRALDGMGKSGDFRLRLVGSHWKG